MPVRGRGQQLGDQSGRSGPRAESQLRLVTGTDSVTLAGPSVAPLALGGLWTRRRGHSSSWVRSLRSWPGGRVRGGPVTQAVMSLALRVVAPLSAPWWVALSVALSVAS
jgi:hypothetical protein